MYNFLLNSKYFTSILSQKVKGTSSSHQRVNPEDIFEVDLIIPNKEDLIRFEKLVFPLITKKDINYNNIESLTKTRDTLLPKLMSGQVRVNNINEESNIVSGDLIEGAEGAIPNNIIDDGPKINLF